MYLQDVDNMFELEWAPGVTYGRVRKEEEYELSRYSFELADVDLHRRIFEDALKEGWRLLDTKDGEGRKDARVVLPAYDWTLKASHAFNVLDARGAISVSQRAGMILGIRKLACAVAARYVGVDTDGSAAKGDTPAGVPRA
jgi:glycyl-tRNA synthetase alpha chain